MKSIRTIQIAALAAIAAMGLAACGSGSADTATPGASASSQTDDISVNVAVDENARALLSQSAKDKGTLTVAMELKYPPTTFLAEDGRTPIGFNPDMSRLIAKKLGLELEIVDVGFDTIIPSLQGNRYDMTVTSMSATAERVAVVDMIDYFKTGGSVAVAKGNPDGFAVDNLCGREVVVTKGSIQATKRLPELSKTQCEDQGKPAITGIILPSVQDAMTQLASGRIKAVYYDTTSLGWAATQQPNRFEVLSPQVNESTVSVALPKGSELSPAVQAAIQSIMGTPEYEEALGRWGLDGLGITEAKLH
ncbi:ABC transporter substrate-binding protein [Pseudonocardia sp. DSM 110487]|uniref:ABC transporter substrate-binding protein n=1 Tax=Pseudonocardia sp. DSM 110487 TaxID=2865833 RepID=UPI002107F5E3|nr:ABC transporter substrate-binding protein [Pseudonocardia sp. DSM 110487]